MAADRKNFSGGISCLLVDLDHTNPRMINTLFHTYDATVSVPSPQPSESIRVHCNARRLDVLDVTLSAITDIRRRTGPQSENGVPSVEIDFSVEAEHISTQRNSSRVVGRTRSLRVVLQTHRGEQQNDAFFSALLQTWRRAVALSSDPRRGVSPGLRSKSPALFGSVDASSEGLSTPRSLVGRSTWAADPASWPRVNREDEYTLITDSDDNGPRMVKRRAYHIIEGATAAGTPMHAEPSIGEKAIDLYCTSEEETNKMLDNCAVLEEELRLIQNRRQQRQQVLMSLEHRDGLESLSAPTSTSKIQYFPDYTKGKTSQADGGAHVDVYDPQAILQGFTAACPYCGIHSSAAHRETCPSRSVQCVRCKSLMKLRDFAVHADLCVRQDANNVPGAVNGYLKGTTPPQQLPNNAPPVPEAPLLLSPGSLPITNPAPPTSNEPKAPLSPQSVASTPPPPSVESKKAQLDRQVSFADIPRVQSMYTSRDRKDSDLKGGKPQPSEKSPKPSMRFVLDEDNLDNERTFSMSSPRKRIASFADDLVTEECPWCRKFAPPDHPRKCAERRVMCTTCGEELYLRDKKIHKELCTGGDDTPSRRSSTLAPASASASSLYNNMDPNDRDEEYELQRRLKKVESYRKRLDLLRKANEANGTPFDLSSRRLRGVQ